MATMDPVPNRSRTSVAPRAARLQAAIAALSIGVLFVMAHVRPEHFIPDDSYFYLEIALNSVAGFGSTFNRITPPNGYHPLWEVVCTALAWVARGDRTTLVHLVLGLQQLLFVATFFLLGRVVAAPGAPARTWLLLPVLAYGFLLLRNYACEAFLYAFLCVCTLRFLQSQWGAFDRRRSFLLGLLAGLIFLARLDSIFLLTALAVTSLFACRDRSTTGSLSHLLAMAAGGLLVALPYLALNWFTFGHLTPISGAIKSTFPSLGFDLGRLRLHGKLSLMFALLLLAVLLRRRDPGTHRLVLYPLIVGAVLHAAYVVLFTDHDTGWLWYYVPGVLCGAALTWILGTHGRLAPVVRWVGIVVLVVATVAAANRYVPELLGRGPQPPRWQVRAAHLLAESVPAGVGIVVADWPGMLAFYSGRPIFSLDGLTADFRYNDEVAREGIAEYCRKRNIRYYVGFDRPYPRIAKGHSNVIRDGVQEVTVYTPLTRVPAGVLRLEDRSKVARFADLFPDPDARGWNMALWRLEER